MIMNVDWTQIRAELDGIKRGGRKQKVSDISANLGISTDIFYRELRKRFGAQKVIERDCRIPKEWIIEIGKIKEYGKGPNGDGREMSTEQAIEIFAMQNGGDITGLTVGTVNRMLRKLGYREPERVVRVEASAANEQHQLDFSRSKYFQAFRFDESRGDYLLKASSKTLFYKEDNTKVRTWLIGVIDAYSRMCLVKMAVATGENGLLGIEFMNFAFNRPEDGHVMRHLPWTLKTDNGAFIKDRSVQAMLQALGIRSELSIPYGHRGIQKIEAAWRRIWQRFELKLYYQVKEGKTIYLSDYNGLMHEFQIQCGQMKHPIKNETREHVYRASLSCDKQRTVEADLLEVAFDVKTRTVDQTCCVSLNNEKFEAPLFAINRQIRVYKNLKGDVVGTLIDEQREPFILKPTEGYVKLGDFEHRQKQTFREMIRGEAAESEKRKVNSTQKAPYPLPFPPEGEREKTLYLPERSEVVKPESVFSGIEEDVNYQFPDAYAARLYIAKQLGRNAGYEDVADVFEELLKEDLKKSSIDAVLAARKVIRNYEL